MPAPPRPRPARPALRAPSPLPIWLDHAANVPGDRLRVAIAASGFHTSRSHRAAIRSKRRTNGRKVWRPLREHHASVCVFVMPLPRPWVSKKKSIWMPVSKVASSSALGAAQSAPWPYGPDLGLLHPPTHARAGRGKASARVDTITTNGMPRPIPAACMDSD